MPRTLPARHLVLAELDAAIGNATGRLRWRRLVLGIRTVARRDTIRAEALLHRAENRLASLRDDRRFLLLAFERSPFPAGRAAGERSTPLG